MLGCRSPRMGAPFQHTAARTGLVLCDTCVTASAVWLLAEWSAAGLAHGGALAGNPTEVLPLRSCSAPDHRRATPCQPPRRASAMLAGYRHGSSWRGSRGTAHGGLFSFRRLPHARTATVCPVCLAHKLSGADWLRGQVVSFPKAIPRRSWIVERLLWADEISALWPTGTPLARTPEEGWPWTTYQRLYGRLGRSRRLAKSFENTTSSATAWLQVACIAGPLRWRQWMGWTAGNVHVWSRISGRGR